MMETVASVIRDRWSLVLTFAGMVGVSACWNSSMPEGRWIFSKPEELQTVSRREDLCARQLEVARATVEHVGIGDSRAVVAAERLMEVASSSAIPRGKRGACRAQAAQLSSELARKYHSHGQKTHNADALADAERLYERYIAAFPDGDDIASMRYFYFEALWSQAELETEPLAQAERWERAKQVYEDLKRAGYREPMGCVLPWTQPLVINTSSAITSP